jgi:hypothetical protein
MAVKRFIVQALGLALILSLITKEEKTTKRPIMII